jgi:hypothetical protein
VESVYSAVRADSLYKADYASPVKGQNLEKYVNYKELITHVHHYVKKMPE